jgi:hypothetical protein
MMDLLARLKGVVQTGEGWSAQCPGHDDQHNSLSLHHRDGHWLLRCHAGCSFQTLIDALGIESSDLFDKKVEGGGSIIPLANRATVFKAGEIGLALRVRAIRRG